MQNLTQMLMQQWGSAVVRQVTNRDTLLLTTSAMMAMLLVGCGKSGSSSSVNVSQASGIVTELGNEVLSKLFSPDDDELLFPELVLNKQEVLAAVSVLQNSAYSSVSLTSFDEDSSTATMTVSYFADEVVQMDFIVELKDDSGENKLSVSGLASWNDQGVLVVANLSEGRNFDILTTLLSKYDLTLAATEEEVQEKINEGSDRISIVIDNAVYSLKRADQGDTFVLLKNQDQTSQVEGVYDFSGAIPILLSPNDILRDSVQKELENILDSSDDTHQEIMMRHAEVAHEISSSFFESISYYVYGIREEYFKVQAIPGNDYPKGNFIGIWGSDNKFDLVDWNSAIISDEDDMMIFAVHRSCEQLTPGCLLLNGERLLQYEGVQLQELMSLDNDSLYEMTYFDATFNGSPVLFLWAGEDGGSTGYMNSNVRELNTEDEVHYAVFPANDLVRYVLPEGASYDVAILDGAAMLDFYTNEILNSAKTQIQSSTNTELSEVSLRELSLLDLYIPGETHPDLNDSSKEFTINAWPNFYGEVTFEVSYNTNSLGTLYGRVNEGELSKVYTYMHIYADDLLGDWQLKEVSSANDLATAENLIKCVSGDVWSFQADGSFSLKESIPDMRKDSFDSSCETKMIPEFENARFTYDTYSELDIVFYNAENLDSSVTMGDRRSYDVLEINEEELKLATTVTEEGGPREWEFTFDKVNVEEVI